MKKDCECTYCQKEVDEYFCITCKFNFNQCESFYEFDGITLCPNCHPKKDDSYKIALGRHDFPISTKSTNFTDR
jgi:hypothetical protein